MNTPTTRRALILGTQAQLLHHIPGLLTRAGFTVDLLTTSSGVSRRPIINNLENFKSENFLIEKLSAINLNQYSLIVIGDDDMLTTIQKSGLSDNKKLTLLPIVSMNDAIHLHSKIALSQILEANKIPTPKFAIAKNPGELLTLANNLGFPVMIKVDQSGGGFGVYSCENENEITKLSRLFLKYPLLIQKKVEGKLADLSGFYQNGELIHFSYSEFEKCIHGPYGPSVVRTYYDLASLPPQILSELKEIGRSLGIHGFTNISCLINSDRSERYYIEVDLRPTIWCDYAKYLGDDPALALKSYFDEKQISILPIKGKANPPKVIAHYMRLNLLELLFNRYGVWSYLDGASLFLLVKQCLIRQPIEGLEYWITCAIKTKIQPHYWNLIRMNYLNFKQRFL